jgi:hypothetical protein
MTRWGQRRCVERLVRWWLVVAVAVLTGCQTAASSVVTGDGVDPDDAATIHAALVTALQTNDRAAVVALTVDEQQAARADTWLQMIAAYRDSTMTEGPYATGGALLDVEIDALVPQGAGRHGISRWRYPRRTICYRTELALGAAGWRVAAFNATTEACTHGR